MKVVNYFLKTYGCQASKADSESISGVLESFGAKRVKQIKKADIIVLNTCSIRQAAEDRVYGTLENIRKLKALNPEIKVVVAGCMIGEHGSKPRDDSIAQRLSLADKLIGTADYTTLPSLLKDLFPEKHSEYLPINYNYNKVRDDKKHAWVIISNGCNNFCTFCIVPYARGREISRPFEDILLEVKTLSNQGYTQITLLGQNVNSYGADLVAKSRSSYIDGKPSTSGSWDNTENDKGYKLPDGKYVKPVMVNSMGRVRIPTLFPYLLEEVCKIDGIQTVDFISSNPWDFSDELIEVIASNNKISRYLHLPLQSGDNDILKKMNRWYTAEEYINLVAKIRSKIPNIEIGTDIIVGFPSENDTAFENTLSLCKQIDFKVAYIGKYSQRAGTVASNFFPDTITLKEKKRRFLILDKLINKSIYRIRESKI